ncbi:unnamed protein product [Orchesella dallaii]|uniref:Uncharacterized protein n=1 Tax=Orchesella dallaii TaxID=48710 RepID=A0ABP1QBT6_9HEXA
MSQNRLNLLEEDSRSFDGKTVDVDEEDFFSFRNEGTLSPHQTWSTFEDLDDSGHFTASPDGERTVSNGGSSPSHSPCPTSAHLLLQMQHHDTNLNSQFHLDLSKPLISPRSIMTVKVPHTNSTISFPPNENNLKNLQTSLSSGFMLKSNVAENEAGDNNNDSIDNVSTQKSSMHIEEEVVPTSKCESSHSSIKYGEESSEYLRSILENFNSLYMEKLRMIDDLVTEGNDEQKKILMEKKTIMLENWAKDVCVQNMVLVHTVEELEREANRKVSALQHKITESTQLAKEHMTMIKKYEQQVKLLLKNHSDTEEKNLVLKIDLEKLKSECRRIRERMNSLLKDNESLVTLMCRIRDMGVWDVSGLELQRSSFDQIFGLYPSLVGSEVQTVFTRQKAKHVKDTEDRILKLEQELANLEKTRKETEVYILQKDRLLDIHKKIEELETEIKNVSNKVQYSEQECNDYKRSLLETQEKLLEATRQLNAAPKIAKPSSAGVNEMGELLRELREVKSQLNMAVEEKQTAREESNYFKKELSDRLKEMHDIQNVFQSLAAEVVNSRAVFQQVQEKEVQLQSLKSEIHTYQSKCTDADDTIRKKETEIINLQKQMNKIHKKRKKRSYMSSSSSSSEKPGSTMLSFYNANLRNVSSPSKIPVRKTNLPIRSSSVKETNKSVNRSSDQGSSQRPPWNTHFKKSIGIISTPAAALPLVPKSSPSKESRSTVRRITTKSQQLSSDQHSVSNKVSEYTYCKSSIRAKSHDTRTNVSSKLPKIELIDTRKLVKAKTVGSGLNENKLPALREPQKKVLAPEMKRPPKKIDNPILKNLIHNPLVPSPRINELITAVVETSKQLLGQQNANAPLRNTFTVTASHQRRSNNHRKFNNEQSARRVKSSDKNAEVNRSEVVSPKVIKKFHSSVQVQKDAGNDKIKIVYESPRDVKEFLLRLPQESQENLVKGWIEKSSSVTSASSRLKTAADKPPLPLANRRPSLKIMKHLATRRFPKRVTTASARSNTSVEKVQEFHNTVFELEDEWEKVFSNLDHSADGRDAKKMDKASSPIKTNGESEVLPDPETERSMDLNSSTGQSQPSSDEEPIQELLNRLALEKQEMEERYRKELQDRDIEIRMQKVTIQHLQDAYVALKRGQPIPVPQSSTGNKISVNGSSNGHNNHVMDTPYALIDNFTVAAPKVDSAQPCNCDNCLNQRSILDLVRRFENRKLHMISELGELKSENSQLENKVSSLEPRLTAVTNKLNSGAELRKKTILQHNSIPLDSSHSKLSSRHLSNIAKNLQPCGGHIQRTGNFHIAQGRQLEDDKYLLQKDSAVIDRHPLNEREALKKSFQVDVQQIENVLHDKQNLEYQLKEVWDCNNFMVEKIQELEKLVKEMEKDKVENEEQLIASHMELPSVKNDHPALDSFSPMNRLEAIKGAFDTNEKIIFTQNQQLTEKVVLLSNYEMYINSMWNCVAQLIPRQELEDPDVKMLDKLEHLCECVKQALIDNGLLCKKLEALQHRLVVANSENAVLNETVAALNDNIEALARQNDKLLQQFHNRNKDSGPLNLSNLSSPRSTLSEEVEKEGSSLLAVDMNASGDFCPSRRKRFSPQVSPTSATLVPVPLKNYDICPCSFSFCSQCRKSESPTQASSHIPPPLLADDDIKEYRENLKLMQKRLLDLDKASRGILAVSLPLFNDPNLCLSSDNSGSITTQQIDGFGEIGDASAIHIGEGRCIQTTDLAQTLKLETNSRS